MDLDPTAAPAELSFTCPRCAAAAVEPFHGPCTSCRTALRASLGSDSRDDVAAVEYEPKMNVVPNAVASKD